jgi:hypothetical protein
MRVFGFFRKSVDSIVANIEKQVQQLRVVEERAKQEANELDAQAQILWDKSKERVNESIRAYNIAQRLAGLIE